MTLACALSLGACASQANSGPTPQQASGGCDAGKVQPRSEAGLEQVTLCLRSGRKTHRFTAEMALTGQQQQQGMMFRTALADDKAMLFPFREQRVASFWMKNTLIPLDIIFIAGDGKIVNIAENATPYSLDPVQSTAPVMAVLELRGGLTAQMGIKAGDKVSWK
jgi:uncharacterized protein